MSRLVAVCGNIASGKTTLCQALSRHPDVGVVEEPVEANPYLERFYRDMPRWALHSQLTFLASRHLATLRAPASTLVLQDRSIREDVDVFATNLHRRGVLNDEDWTLYSQVAEITLAQHPAYDLAVYLKADVPTLMARIGERRRAMEQGIDRSYIQDLANLYDDLAAEMARTTKLIIVDTEQIDIRDTAVVLALDRSIRAALETS